MSIDSYSTASAAKFRFRRMSEWLADLIFAARLLRKSLGFSLITVASLGLAIGANTAIFSYANELLFVRLGVPHGEELRIFRLVTGSLDGISRDLYVGEDQDSYRDDSGHFHLGVFPYPTYKQLREQNHSLEDIFAFQQLSDIPIVATGAPQVAKVEVVSGNFYTQMQVKPQLGRFIGPADDRASEASAVAVISDAFWHRNYGGSPSVLGKVMRVGATPATIVGVNPPGFHGPDGAEITSPQVYLPLSMMPAIFPSSDPALCLLVAPQEFWLHLMARTKSSVSTSQAEAAMNVAFNAAFRSTASVGKGVTIPRLVLLDGSHGSTMARRMFMQPLYLLSTLAGLVLLLACANVATLMLARASFRQREMSVRIALGASRGRILQLALAESFMLSVVGGSAGMFLGYISRNLIPWLMRTGWDGGEMPVGFDWRIFAFTTVITLLTGTVFGILPAWRMTRTEINTALKERTQTTSRKRNAWSGKAIVCFQVALSTLLVMSAAFFLRTLANLNSVDPGFQTQSLLLFDISALEARYPDRKAAELHRHLEETLAAVPGVQSETMINTPLLADGQLSSVFQIRGTDLTNTNTQTMESLVGPRFFSTMSIPIIAGRGFSSADTATSKPVSIINQALARELFPGTNPIGKHFRKGLRGADATRWIEIIGVCADTSYSDLRSSSQPVHFDLGLQSPSMPNTVSYIVRSPLRPDTLLPSLRHAVQQIDPDLPLTNIRTQQQQIAATMQQERMFASLTGGFGMLALALACVGIYGIMAYTVSQRTNEIGIRLALGAARGQVRGMILRETGSLAISGVVIGSVATLVLIRFAKAMLYGLSPNDPLTLGGSGFLLIVTALIAGWTPAYRASQVNPIESLRQG